MLRLLIAKGLKIILNPSALRNCTISKKAKICAKSELNYTNVDDYTYIGYQCYAIAASIGKFNSIGDNSRIGGPSHPFHWVSTSPVFISGKNVLKKNISRLSYNAFEPIIIENDVWIGANVLVKSGIKIQNGAVIGMGSVVTHDVGPYEVWGGNPAKMIKKRFDDDTIAKLQEIKWWDMDEVQLSKYAQYFNKPIEFLNVFERDKSYENSNANNSISTE